MIKCQSIKRAKMVQKIQTGEGKIEKVQKVKKDSKNVQKMIVTNTK